MAEAANIRIVLSAETASLSAGLATASRLVGGFATTAGREMGVLSNVMSGVGQVMGKVNPAMVAGGSAFLALAVGAKAAIGAAIEFESAWAGVVKTVGGRSSTTELAALRTELIEMSKVMPVAATELAKIAQIAGQLGVSTPYVAQFTEVIAMLGEATDMSVETAATQMARFQNIMQLPRSSVDELGSAIVNLGNNVAATEGEIMTLTLRLAPVGNLVGMSAEGVMGFAAAMKALGVESESGGTAVQRTWLSIDSAVKSGGDQLTKFAAVAQMTSSQFQELWNDSPEDAFVAFLDGLAAIEASGGDVNSVLDSLDLRGQRVIKVLLGMSSNTGEVKRALDLASTGLSENTALLDEYGNRVETTASRLEILKGRLTAIGINAGTPLLDGVVAVVDGVGDAIERLVTLVTPLSSELFDLFSGLAGAVGEFYDALGSPILQGAAVALAAVAGALQLVVMALNAMPPGVALVVGALALKMALVGPASVSAAAGLLAFNLAGRGVAGAALGMQAAMGSLLASIGPVVAIAAPLLLVGKAWQDAGTKASESTAGFVGASAAVVTSSGSFAELKATIGATQDEMARLRDIDTAYNQNDGITGFFEKAKIGGLAMLQVLPFVENSVMNNQRAWEDLEDSQQRMEFENLAQAAEILAGSLGISTEAAYQMITATDMTDEAMAGATGALQTIRAAVQEYAVAQGLAAGATEEASTKFIEYMAAFDAGQGSLEMFAADAGLSLSEIAFLADEAGVSLNDLVDDKKWGPAQDAVKALAASVREFAADAGFSLGQLAAMDATIGEMVGSVGEVQTAMSEASAAMDASTWGVDQLAAAQAAFDAAGVAMVKARDGIKEVGEEFTAGTASGREYAESMSSLALAYAASGASASEAVAYQRELIAGFREAGAAAGLTEAEIATLITQYGLVPEEVLTMIALEGTQAKTEADQYLTRMELLNGKIFLSELAVKNTGLTEQEVWTLADAASLNFGGQTYTAAIDLEADKALAEAVNVALTLEAIATGDWTTVLMVDDDMARQRMAAILLDLGKITQDEYDVILNGGGDAVEKIVEVKARLDEVSAGSYVANLLAEVSDEDLSAAYELIKDFDGTQATAEAFMRVTGQDDLVNAAKMIAALTNKTVVIDLVIAQKGGGSYDGRGLRDVFVAQGAVIDYFSEGSENHVAQIAPAGSWRVWGEPETGGEAYIPLAASKRGRSESILNDVARRFGKTVIPQANGGILNFADGGIASFATKVGLPNIQVAVSVNAEALGNVAVDLSPVNRSLLELEGNFNKAGRAATALGGAADTLAVNAGEGFTQLAGRAADFGDGLRKATEVAGDGFTQLAGRVIDFSDGLRRAFVDLPTQAQIAGREMLKALAPDEFLAAFSRISGWASESFVQWLGVWDGTVEQAVSKLDAAGLEMRHIFDQVFLEGASSAEAMYDAFAAAGVDMATAAQEAGASMLEAMAPEKFLDTFSRLSGWAKDAFVTWLGEWDGSVSEAFDKLEEAGLELGFILEAAFREGATQAEVLDMAIESVSESLDKVEDSARRADDALTIMTGRTRDMVDAQISYLDAVERVQDAVGEGDLFGMSDADARQNLETLMRAGDAMREYGIAVAASGVSAGEAISTFSSLREEFRQLALDAGLPAGEVEKLIAMLFSVPASVLTQITVDAAAANADAASFVDAMAAIDGTVATPIIEADIAAAEGRIAIISGLLQVINDTVAIASLEAEKAQLEAVVAAANAQLAAIDGTVATPKVAGDDGGFQQMKGRVIIDVRGLHSMSATPRIGVIDAATGPLAKIRAMILSIPKDVSTRISTTTVNDTINRTTTVDGGTLLPGRFAFADGGIERHVAQIAPAGAMRLWAEPETGGEAYIPLAPWKRGRSEMILDQVANSFGRRVVPMAGGGIIGGRGAGQGGIVVHAPINVQVDGAGDPVRAANLVGQEMDRRLDQFADKLEMALSRR